MNHKDHKDRIEQLPDWMYHAIEESYTCQFASTTARAIPVALPVILSHFDPDTGTLVISSPAAMKRVENVRRRSRVAILFAPSGVEAGEPKHVLLVQGLAEVGLSTGCYRCSPAPSSRPGHGSRCRRS